MGEMKLNQVGEIALQIYFRKVQSGDQKPSPHACVTQAYEILEAIERMGGSDDVKPQPVPCRECGYIGEMIEGPFCPKCESFQ